MSPPCAGPCVCWPDGGPPIRGPTGIRDSPSRSLAATLGEASRCVARKCLYDVFGLYLVCIYTDLGHRPMYLVCTGVVSSLYLGTSATPYRLGSVRVLALAAALKCATRGEQRVGRDVPFALHASVSGGVAHWEQPERLTGVPGLYRVCI